MKRQRSHSKSAEMSSDAYAGFLKLLLTPASQVPIITPDVEAYLRYVNDRESLPLPVLGNPSRQAA